MSHFKIVVLAANCFSGQDLVDLLLDDPNKEVIGVGRSPEKGLFERDFVINAYKLLSDKSFKNIRVHNNSIFGNNQDLWKINLLDLKIENFESNVVNFSISGDFNLFTTTFRTW